MPKKKVKRKRDYKKEYRQYGSKPEQKKQRAMRNAARRKALRDGRVRKGDRLEVDHVRPLSRGGTNKPSNLRIVSRKNNRSRKPK